MFIMIRGIIMNIIDRFCPSLLIPVTQLIITQYILIVLTWACYLVCQTICKNTELAVIWEIDSRREHYRVID